MQRHLSYRALPLVVGISLAACGAAIDDQAASVDALADASASQPGLSTDTYKGGASTNPGVVDASIAQQALTALTRNVDTSVSGFQSEVASGNALAADSGSGGGLTQSVDVHCAGGGAADVEGHMNMSRAALALDVKLAIAFSGCTTPSGTMIDGNIEFSQALTTAQDTNTAFQVETIYEGDVNISGDVNVSCPVDLNVLVDQQGRALEVQGTFCNQDASHFAMQLQPLWQSR